MKRNEKMLLRILCQRKKWQLLRDIRREKKRKRCDVRISEERKNERSDIKHLQL